MRGVAVSSDRERRLRPGKRHALGWALALLVGLAGLAVWPVTTYYGVNYQWFERRITLGEKAIHFISRDLQTSRLTKEMIAGAGREDEKLMRIFSWVTTHVRPTPEGFPVVDDHPLHILIRGYGASDQRAEAFVVLAGYAGLRGRVAKLLHPRSNPKDWFPVALVEVGPRTCVFDPVNAVAFTDEQGRCLGMEELLRHPDLIQKTAPGLSIGGLPYEGYLMNLRDAKTFSRTELQQPWRRLWRELVYRVRPSMKP